MQLLIAGDLVPTQSNIDLFNKADTRFLLGDKLLSLWNFADTKILNLEVPLTDKESPIGKYGPNLIAPTSTINGIKNLNPSLITLANNHILDHSDSELWQTSLLIEIEIKDELNINYIPIIKKENVVRLAEYEVSKEILENFHIRSKEILQEGFIEKQYEKFAEKSIELYLRSFSGVGKWLSRIDRYLLKGSLLKHRYNKNQLLTMQNHIECEAHRELFLTYLKGENHSEIRKF